MKSRSRSNSPTERVISNRRARYDYELGESLVVGVALSGPEVRAARDGHVHLKGAFVTLRNDELWLNNASFSVKLNERGVSSQSTVDTTARKLLAHRREINALQAKLKTGMTIVPLKLLTDSKHIKLVIAPGKGKKRYDKRESIKQRDIERNTRHYKG